MLERERPFFPSEGSAADSRSLREQVTTGAARTLREMVSAIFVATQADGALGRGWVFVSAVAQVARLMLGLCVQARQFLQLMAARACGNARDSGRPMRAMAGSTTGAQLAMSALLLGAVAIRAGLLCGQADVRLVAIGANLVPLGRGLLFGRVATRANFCLLSGVGLVAANAAGMAGFDQARFTLVAVVATDFVGFRLVRQALVATGARLVTFVERDLLHARLVAPRTGRDVAQRELETVRFVAAGAGGGAVRAVIGRRKLVARSAASNLHAFGGA